MIPGCRVAVQRSLQSMYFAKLSVRSRKLHSFQNIHLQHTHTQKQKQNVYYENMFSVQYFDILINFLQS